MLTSNPIEIFLWGIGVFVSLNLLIMTLFVLCTKLPNNGLKISICNIIVALDKAADEMGNQEKRARAIQQIIEMLGWWKIAIPTPLIGWVIDTEVGVIHTMEQSTDSQQRIVMRQITLSALRELALRSKDNLWSAAQGVERDVKLYLHWSAGRYGQLFDEYHINIDYDGSIYVPSDDLAALRLHTYKRNTGSIGIVLACCYGATTEDFGSAPPTPIQIEVMSQVVAVLCTALDLTVDLYRVMTHAEAANNLDGLAPLYADNGYPDGKYGPGFSCERWDLWFIPGVAKGEGGTVVRGKAIWYQHHGVGV